MKKFDEPFQNLLKQCCDLGINVGKVAPPSFEGQRAPSHTLLTILYIIVPFNALIETDWHVSLGYDFVMDAMFGFGFQGPLRAPFDSIVESLKGAGVPLMSIDVPSGWHVDKGSADRHSIIYKFCIAHIVCEFITLVLGNQDGAGLEPHVLISLTAPKLCSRHFRGRHCQFAHTAPSPYRIICSTFMITYYHIAIMNRR